MLCDWEEQKPGVDERVPGSPREEEPPESGGGRKGKAKVEDSWCTGWVAQAEARRRNKETRRREEESGRREEEGKRAAVEAEAILLREKGYQEQEVRYGESCLEKGFQEREKARAREWALWLRDEPEGERKLAVAGKFITEWKKIQEETGFRTSLTRSCGGRTLPTTRRGRGLPSEPR